MAKSDTAQATASANDSKLKALQTTIEKLDKAFGKGTVMRLSESKVVDIPVISTGSLGLDLALGIGGMPRGRVVEIYGPESSGKTTLTMHCIAEAQKAGGLAAFIDAEPRLTGYTQKSWVSIQKTCSSHSLTMANRRSKSPNTSSVQVLLTLLLLTPLLLLYRRPRLKAKWAKARWVCKLV